MKNADVVEKVDVRVYSYGLCFRKQADGRRPTIAPLVYEQLRAANAYYNQRVEMENARRADWNGIRRNCFPKLARAEDDYEVADKAVASARDAVKKAKSVARTRKVDPAIASDLKVLLKDRSEKKKHLSLCREEYKDLLSPADAEFKRRMDIEAPKKDDVHQVRRARKSVLDAMLDEKQWPAAWKLSRKLDYDVNEKKNAVRKASGVTKGTYDLVDAAFDQAAKTSKGSIRFHRYSGGRVGLSVSSGTDEAMSGKGSSFRIDPLPEGTWDTASGRRHAVTNVRLRLGRGLEEVVFPIVMHRPLPPGAEIKAVWLKEEVFGVRRRWFLQITVKGGPKFVRKNPPPGSLVALNLSWKMVDGGLRSGYWVGSDGEEGEVLLRSLPEDGKYFRNKRSEYLYNSLMYPLDLGQIISLTFDRVMVLFLEQLKVLDFPAWVKNGKDLLKTVSQWRSPMRLCGYSRFLCEQTLTKDRMSVLWRLWRDHRIGGVVKLDLMPEGPGLSGISSWAASQGVTSPLEVFSLYLEIWRRKHIHLYDWKNQTMDRAMRARREMYRILARKLSGRYETLLIEDFDLRDVLEDALPEEESDKIRGAGLRRVVASPSILRSSLLAAFGGRYRKYDPAGNTMFHAGCGGAMIGDVDNVIMTCAKCGGSEDRDRNNCLNQIDTARGSSKKPRSISKKDHPLAKASR